MNQKRHAELSTALQAILAKLIHEYRAEKIILFGSFATGTVGEWSDIDLAIIKETPKPFVDRSVEAALLCRAPVGVDYLVYTPTEFLPLIRGLPMALSATHKPAGDHAIHKMPAA